MNFDTFPHLKEKLNSIPSQTLKDEYRLLVLFGIAGLAGLVRLLVQLRTETFSWLYLIIFLIFTGLMIANALRLSKKRKFASSTWDTLSEQELKALEETVETAKVIGSSLIASGLLVTNTAYGPEVLRLQDAVWLYAASSEETRNAITSAKDFELCIVDRNKVKYVIAKAKTREEVEVLKSNLTALLKAISQVRPNMLVGFGKENQELFAQNFERMVEAADRQTSEAKPQVPPSYNWEVSTDEETFGTPSVKHIDELLDQVLAGNAKYLLLTPPDPVDGISFLQVTAENERFKVAFSKNGLYIAPVNDKAEVMMLIQTFIEEKKGPDVSHCEKQ